MASSSTASRFIVALPALGAAALVLAVLSCWEVGWLSDDWVLRERTGGGALFEESRHLSVPRRALWWAAAHGAGPWLFRLVGLGCHLAASLVVLPRLAALMFPAWPATTGYLAGLVLLGLPAVFEGLVWPSAVSYPVLELELLAVAYAHLRWLRDGGRAWRVGSMLATAAALATWELGVAAPLVVLIGSAVVARRGRRTVRDVAPHALLLVLWLGVKLGLHSTDALPWRGATRVAGHVLATPLLALSPWPLDHRLLAGWPGPPLAVCALVVVLAAAWRLGRNGAALLLLAWGVLVPVLPGPGPEARYLLIAAPWLVLLVTAALRDLGARSGPLGRVALTLGLVCFCAGAAGASWWLAGRWRAADAIARGLLDGVVEAAKTGGRREVVVIDAPDRLPGWGPTSKTPVWRHGLREAVATRGLRLVAQAHTAPGDPEVVGLQPSTPPWTGGDLQRWRARNLLVLICRPDGHGGYEVVRFER